jgi:hypothetical protein
MLVALITGRDCLLLTQTASDDDDDSGADAVLKEEREFHLLPVVSFLL